MKISIRAAIAAIVFTALFAGCPKKPAGQPDAGAVAEPAGTPDAGAPELTFRITGDVPDGGGTVELPITPGTRTEVPQVQAIHVATNVGLHNYRIRLFDEADRAMVSDDTADDGAQGTRYDIVLAGPLKTGFKYSLVVEAETGPMFEDVTGRDHPDLRVDWIVAGEKEKPPPPPKRPSRRRRH